MVVIIIGVLAFVCLWDCKDYKTYKTTTSQLGFNQQYKAVLVRHEEDMASVTTKGTIIVVADTLCYERVKGTYIDKYGDRFSFYLPRGQVTVDSGGIQNSTADLNVARFTSDEQSSLSATGLINKFGAIYFKFTDEVYRSIPGE